MASRSARALAVSALRQVKRLAKAGETKRVTGYAYTGPQDYNHASPSATVCAEGLQEDQRVGREINLLRLEIEGWTTFNALTVGNNKDQWMKMYLLKIKDPDSNAAISPYNGNLQQSFMLGNRRNSKRNPHFDRASIIMTKTIHLNTAHNSAEPIYWNMTKRFKNGLKVRYQTDQDDSVDHNDLRLFVWTGVENTPAFPQQTHRQMRMVYTD